MEARNATRLSVRETDQYDSTTTFVIGFGVLLIFILIGILASIFLCVTLKKDPFLWEIVFDPQSPAERPAERPADGRKRDEDAAAKPTSDYECTPL